MNHFSGFHADHSIPKGVKHMADEDRGFVFGGFWIWGVVIIGVLIILLLPGLFDGIGGKGCCKNV
jgi:hypothetical protein